MFLECEKCETQYKLDATRVGGQGRNVRCSRCGHVWFFTPAPAAIEAAESSKSSFEQMMRDEQADYDRMATPGPDEVMESINAENHAAENHAIDVVSAAHEDTHSDVPHVVPPDDATLASDAATMPIVEYRPAGMGAAQFGLFVFLLPFFISLIVLFAGRNMIVHHFPVMLSAYRVIGLDVAAPGEGLRLSEMTAAFRAEDGKKSLDVSLKLSNISDHDKGYPALKITLKGPYGADLKDWEYKTDGKQLASGEVVPLKLTFGSAPDDGTTVEVKVIE